MALEASVKADMKYKLQEMKPQMDEAAAWITAVTGRPMEGTFDEWLRSGAVLCHLLNGISPGAVKKVNLGALPFKQMENITMFTRGVKKLGMHESDCFDTNDLFMGNDIAKVIQSLFAFGSLCQSSRVVWDGPHLGVKKATKTVRTFSEKQLMESRAAVSKITMGSHGLMERTHIAKQGITVGNEHAGGAGSGQVTKMMMGSGGTMERTHIAKQGITTGNECGGSGAMNVMTKMSVGSSDIMNRTYVAKQGITTGADASGKSTDQSVTMATQGSAGIMQRPSVAKMGITFGNDMSARKRPPAKKLW